MAFGHVVGRGREILAGAERPPFTPHHHGPHARVEAQLVGDGTQLVGRTPRPRVQLLGPVERDDADGPFLLEPDQRLFHGVSLRPGPTLGGGWTSGHLGTDTGRVMEATGRRYYENLERVLEGARAAAVRA